MTTKETIAKVKYHVEDLIAFLGECNLQGKADWYKARLKILVESDGDAQDRILKEIRRSLFGMGSLTDNPTISKDVAKQIEALAEKVVQSAG